VAMVSFAVDLADIVTNLAVAAVTGSAVIFAEMAQGIADAIGSLLLVVGERRSRLPDDPRYPTGHSREVFFWALLSSIVMLVVGSGLSFWRGYRQLTALEPLEHPYLALAVLVLSTATNGYATSQSYRRLRASGLPLRRAFREESQPLVKTAFLQDSLGTASAVVGLCSLILYAALGASPMFDALGALAIACLMVAFSITLIVQVHHLIAGRPVPRGVRESIRRAVLALPEVDAVNELAATFAGSVHVVVELDLDLTEELTTAEIEKVLERVRLAVATAEPRAIDIHVNLSSPQVWARGRRPLPVEPP
jgi:cation diffusion facilitator family transporter